PAPDDPIYATDWQVPLPDTFGEATLAGKPDAQRQMQKVMRLALGDIPLDRRDLWASFNNYYYNCLRDMDRHLGRVLDALDESGQSDNTIVIFMADHGEMGGVHGLRSKGGNMYREDQNVPLMIRHPDVKKAREVEALASQLDIAPTLLALAGVSDAERRTAYPI
uniref:sulfatase-like hydrolase/transferase n=1 Tax=uncultured Parvibaculum sp. TaxID=291828 RepID=UPI0030D93977